MRNVVVAFVVVEFTRESAVMEEDALRMIPTVEVGVIAFAPEYCQFENVFASVPQRNCRVAELHRSFEVAPEQVERPAPCMVDTISRFVVVDSVEVARIVVRPMIVEEEFEARSPPEKVASPVTPRVEENVPAPVTPKVPPKVPLFETVRAEVDASVVTARYVVVA